MYLTGDIFPPLSIREPVLAVAPVRGAEPRARRAAHVVPPGGQGRQPRRRPGQEQEAAAPRAVGVPLATPEEALCGGTHVTYSAVKVILVKGCVNYSRFHATFHHIYYIAE